ncbi:MAG: DUF2938 domain-containing protein [Sneathiellales bacterium]|nr:DUF2938 domain-containing protein [Sneathiellales bacterium]
MLLSSEWLLFSLLLGIGATLVMDIWAFLQLKIFKIPSLNYALVGRWIGHMFKGVFRHQPILQSPSIKGEALLGWTAHYAIGVLFAGAFLAVLGTNWMTEPDFVSALLMGIITVSAPFFLMQPSFGFGIAASKTPAPKTARIRSLIAHTSFGVGLYLTALLFRFLQA